MEDSCDLIWRQKQRLVYSTSIAKSLPRDRPYQRDSYRSLPANAETLGANVNEDVKRVKRRLKRKRSDSDEENE